MKRLIAILIAWAGLCLAVRAEEPARTDPPAPAAPPAAAKPHPALEEYTRALDAIQRGNEAQLQGSPDDAYCLYDEAIMRLNGLKGRYPDWEREKVLQQIKNVLDVKEKLVAVVCKDHEEMKQGRFRFLVWQRQVAMIRRLDVVLEKLDQIEKDVEENRRDIMDLRDRILDRR
ncbi:MAG: hypothetical protein PHN82_11455 [bacterium]|nr:hypothetical protein [bacterium]